MKKFVVVIILLMLCCDLFAQESKINLYTPGENAEQKIAEAIKKAKGEGKYVLIMIGGNWCGWCLTFHHFVTKDAQIDSIIKSAYVVYNMNVSKEDFNAKLLARYGYPQRFGCPVFLVLDGEGNRIHTQDSSYLEDGKKSYDRDKVIAFLSGWSPAALDPKQYKDQ